MITLNEAINTIKNEKKYKKFFDEGKYEIFCILENNNEWIFVINGIDYKGERLLLQPIVRMVSKITGELSMLSYALDEDFINSHTKIFSRQKTYKESKFFIEDYFKKYEIKESYESNNHHLFIIKEKTFNLITTVLIDRYLNEEKYYDGAHKELLKDEDYTKID